MKNIIDLVLCTGLIGSATAVLGCGRAWLSIPAVWILFALSERLHHFYFDTQKKVEQLHEGSKRVFDDPELELRRIQAEIEIVKCRELERLARCWLHENWHWIDAQLDVYRRLEKTKFEVKVCYSNEAPRPSADELFQRARATVERLRRDARVFAHAIHDSYEPYVCARTGCIPKNVDQPMGIWIKKE